MMQKRLQHLVSQCNVRQLSHAVRSDEELYKWVLEETKSIEPVKNLNERVYYILFGRPNCKSGKERKFLTFSRGYGYCSRSEFCACLQKDTSAASQKHWREKTEAQLQEIHEKRTQTNINKYGVNNAGQTDKAKKNRERLYQDSSKVATIINKIKKTKQALYGDESYNNIKKRKVTCIEKYGSEEFVSSQEYKRQRKKSLLKKEPKKALLYDVELLGKIAQEKTPAEIASELGYVNSSSVIQRLKTFGLDYKRGRVVSLLEEDLKSFVRDHYSGPIISGSRKIIPPYEIDIYLPEEKFGIELNGLFWHSESQGKDCRYHLEKTERCLEQGINLVHIWDFEWRDQKQIVQSRILHKLGSATAKVMARDCNVSVISRETRREFLNTNHAQGDIGGSINLGLFHDKELIAVAVFSKPRFNRNYNFEWLRFCGKNNTLIQGGAGKLLKHFIRTHNPPSIISYADRRWGEGEVYTSLGFEFLRNTKPNYWYTSNYQTLLNRIKFQKHKLSRVLTEYDTSLTESENMHQNGFDRVWDCGNAVYVWLKDK